MNLFFDGPQMPLDPLKEATHPPSLHISRTGDQDVGYFVASRQAGEFSREIIGIPPNWSTYEEIENKYQKAEEERLLYVATTRAKQLLVISTYPEKPDKGAWKDLYPYLAEVDELEKGMSWAALFIDCWRPWARARKLIWN